MPISFEDCMIIGKLGNLSDDMVKQLELIIEEINKKESKFKIAKSVGTGIEIFGQGTVIVGICLIPLSAGTSQVVVAVGSLATVLGKTVIVVTDYYKYKSDKHIRETIVNLAKRREEIIKECIEKIGLCEKKNFIALEKWDKSYDWVKDANRVFTLGQIAYGGYDSTKLALAASRALNTVNPESRGVNTYLKGAFALTGLVFGIIDVYSLMKDWNKVHPSLQHINELVNALKNDIELFRLLFNIKSNPESSQEHFIQYFNKISQGYIIDYSDEGFVENYGRRMIE